MLKQVWKFLSEFSGVIASLLLIWGGILFVLNFVVQFRYNPYLFLGTITIFLLALIRILIWATIYFREQFRGKQISQDIKQLDEKVKHNPNHFVVPDNKMLSRWLEYVTGKAKKWSEDVYLTSTSLYIHCDDTKINSHLQAYFYSNLKELQMIQYAGSVGGYSIDDNNGFILRKEPFFEEYKMWSKIIMVLHSRLADRLPPTYSVAIHGVTNGLIIEFKYRSGNIDKTENFRFSDSKLTETKTGKVIQFT